MGKETYETMKQRAEAEQGKIELRSEKVRNMIGEIPPFLVRWGNTILVIIFLLLIAIGWWIVGEEINLQRNIIRDSTACCKKIKCRMC